MPGPDYHAWTHLPDGTDPLPSLVRTIRGSIENDGTIHAGEGFTSDATPGDSSGTAATGAQCEITFDEAFTAEPIVVVAPGYTDPYRANAQLLGNPTATGFTVTTYDIDDADADGAFAFAFIAIQV